MRLLRAYLRQVPQDGEIRYYLGLSLQQMGYYDEALSEVRAAKAIVPANSALSKKASDTIRILQLKQRMAPPKKGPAPPPQLAPAPGAAPQLMPKLEREPSPNLPTHDPVMGPLLAPMQNNTRGP